MVSRPPWVASFLRHVSVGRSEISKKNFRGIELRDFAAEIARLALVIAEYQCDVLHRGPLAAKAEFLPLDEMNWITCGNALRLDWLQACNPEGREVRIRESGKLNLRAPESKEVDFENEGGEVFICGNPPYLGSNLLEDEQKADVREVLQGRCPNVGNLDYVSAWFVKAADFGRATQSISAFVATNSICQGQAVPDLWPIVYDSGADILFAHTSLRWTNLASHNAGVTVVIVGIGQAADRPRRLFSADEEDRLQVREGKTISPYLTIGSRIFVSKQNAPISDLPEMEKGSQPTDGGNLLLSPEGAREALGQHQVPSYLIRKFVGAEEYIQGRERYCIWVEDNDYAKAQENEWLKSRFAAVSAMRLASPKVTTQRLASKPYRFGKIRSRGGTPVTLVPSHSSENRPYLPIGLLPAGTIASNAALAIFDAPQWNFAIAASKLHLVWIATVCGKLETRYRYSNTLGWNTFPVPSLTEQDKDELTRCAEDILLSREAHFPATIADLYEPEAMPENLRASHDRNDETLERIYIGRRFKNDTERLETLFAMYAKMTAGAGAGSQGTGSTSRGRKKKEVQA